MELTCFFPRIAYEEVGGFDERIFLYGEEGELQYRMKKAGYTSSFLTSPRYNIRGEKFYPSIGNSESK